MKFGDISPLGALVTGEGALADISRKGGFGLLPYMATKGRGKKKEDEEPKRMKKGGAVKYAKGGKVRGCGCAKRGIKKAKMY
jgi:hypothetical protein